MPSSISEIDEGETMSRPTVRGRRLILAGPLIAAALVLGHPRAVHADTATPTLTVATGSILRPAFHAASGGLYGLATDTIPGEKVVAPLHPNAFVQMAPNGRQLPNGETSPAGDVLQTLALAHEVGAKVVVRMPDWFPTFPYSNSGTLDISEWDSEVDNQVQLVEDSRYAGNVAAFAIWNEPDANWTGSITDDSGNPLDFNTFWEDTYQEIRRTDPNVPIQGPSFSRYGSGACSAAGMTATNGADCGSIQAFLQFTANTDTLPNIIAWHELSGQQPIQNDVADYRSFEDSVIGRTLPIAIEEYGEPGEVGIPGDLVGYIAKFERTGVDNAELAFWNEYGSLGDTLTGTGGAPNGSYWLYRWYADMQGDMVSTTPSNVPASSRFDGAASVSSDKRQVSVILGGNSGATQVTLNGLDRLRLGSAVNVSLQYVPSFGRQVPVTGPLTISDTVQKPANGSLTVAIPAVNANDGYRVVLTPAVTQPGNLSGTYRITNLNSGLALNPQGPSVVQSPGGGSSELWNVRSTSATQYTIQNQRSGLFLAGTANSGAGVTLVQKPSGADDEWQFSSDGTGHDTIADAGAGSQLGVQDRGTAPQTPVVQDAPGAPTPVCTATTVRAAGEFGNAVSLCGDGEYVQLPNGIVSGLTANFTISAWIDPRANTMWSRVFDFGTGTGNYMFLADDNAGGDVRFAITNNGPGAEQGISSSFPIDTFGQSGAASFDNSSADLLPLNQWSLVTVTLAGNVGTLYVNGVPVGSNDAITLTPSALGQTTQDWLGRSEFGDPFFNGGIDDFTISDNALTAAEAAALAKGTGPGTGDVADYRFDEASGATVADSSGNGRTATIVSDPTNNATETGTSDDQLWQLARAGG
jgi:hypothetical protein